MTAAVLFAMEDDVGVAQQDTSFTSCSSLGLKMGASNSDWMDRFMNSILAREYDAAREILRSAIARGVGKSVAEQYGKVLEEFLRRRDELEQPLVDIAHYGVCALREMDNQTGRGLIVPGFVGHGDELWRQRPLAYIQSPSSRKCVQVCSACFAPVGTLASQLAYLGLPAQDGAEMIKVVDGAGPVISCPGGCGDVYCSQSCCTWAQEFSSHALLCRRRLPIDAAAALEALDALAVATDTEHLLLLAHHVAVAVLRRQLGDDLLEVMHKYVGQLFSKPYDALATEDAIDGDTPASRRDLVNQAQDLLRRIFVGQELAEPFLETSILSGMLGTYDLVNMTISIPHPLNTKCDSIAELLGESTLIKLNEQQRTVDDSDTEDECEEDEAEDTQGDADNAIIATVESLHDEGRPNAIEVAMDAVKRKALFANVVGTSLVEALSFMNHCCLPNARIEFDNSVMPHSFGPGLWVYSASRRPLIPGDEATMCYVPSVIGKSVEKRQKRMKEFGFECQCRCCTTDLMLLSEGDVVIK
jgi:hypothetical protein|eukprot:CAMPEP_0169107456 /NCGR_PEP_ID=MMETSP1015-20121227/24896_1 /TAXON_ID=342587 /ORGANISM="Karlodinium micrum, Strain CCMP2283" /LENGTH=528 /DNA_ID=CAMNT_0009168997 /DNA_START=88 /DNA_END=1674 /DNA_ORIENTATION=+